MVDPVALLAGLKVFPGFTPEELTALAGVLKLERLNPGQLLFREGARGKACYLIAHGEVSVWLDREERTELAVLGRGELFGQVALLDGGPRSANCSGVGPGPTVVFRLDRDDFDLMFRSGSSFAYKFVDVLTRLVVTQLRRANARVVEMAEKGPESDVDAFFGQVFGNSMSIDLDDVSLDDVEVVTPSGLEYRKYRPRN